MYNVNFVLFETAQTAESQQISIGEDDSPKIFLINTDNRHFDTLEPQVDGSYFRRQQPSDGNCMYHSVTPGLLKFIPENLRHNSPNYLRNKIASWVNDDTNFHDGAEWTTLDSLEQRPASNGGSLETDQVIDHKPLLQENPQEKPHSKNQHRPSAIEQLRKIITNQIET